MKRICYNSIHADTGTYGAYFGSNQWYSQYGQTIGIQFVAEYFSSILFYYWRQTIRNAVS